MSLPVCGGRDGGPLGGPGGATIAGTGVVMGTNDWVSGGFCCGLRTGG